MQAFIFNRPADTPHSTGITAWQAWGFSTEWSTIAWSWIKASLILRTGHKYWARNTGKCPGYYTRKYGKVMKQEKLLIKTHGSVLCSPRSQRAIPMSILTGRTIMRIRNFVLLVQNWTIFAVQMPATVSTPHSKFQINCTRGFQDINFQKLAYLFLYFLFVLVWKFCGNKLSDCLEIWYTEKWCNSTSWYQVGLEYNKHSQSYMRLFTKNNTNMLLRPQGKPWMVRSWKLVQR